MRRARITSGRGQRQRRRVLAACLAAVTVPSAVVLTGCATLSNPVPTCHQPLRLALIAQSVPTASYVPCVHELPPGWSTSGYRAVSGRTSFLLESDRSPAHPVTVTLSAACDLDGATPSPPRAPGVRTYTRLRSISPRVTGTLFDVFPGGCTSYRFDFAAGPNVALTDQFEQAVALYPRQQLRLVLKRKLGVELTP
jgi:hypothetical protein